MLRSNQYELEDLSEALSEPCALATKGKHVLAIQDTTELNYEKHRALLNEDDPNLGPISNGKSIGYYLHPTLVLDAEKEYPLGFSSVEAHSRDWEKKSPQKIAK